MWFSLPPSLFFGTNTKLFLHYDHIIYCNKIVNNYKDKNDQKIHVVMPQVTSFLKLWGWKLKQYEYHCYHCRKPWFIPWVMWCCSHNEVNDLQKACYRHSVTHFIRIWATNSQFWDPVLQLGWCMRRDYALSCLHPSIHPSVHPSISYLLFTEYKVVWGRLLAPIPCIKGIITYLNTQSRGDRGLGFNSWVFLCGVCTFLSVSACILSMCRCECKWLFVFMQ